MKLVVLGLSITSSWGNGHATTYRALLREFAQRGHEVVFLERDAPWYAENRDLPVPPYCHLELYTSQEDLKRRFVDTVKTADAVIVGSYVPEGIAVGEWVLETATGHVAFYDIDTPVTLTALESGKCEYLSADLVQHYPLYLSFTGGPTLERLQKELGSPRAEALYCSVDATVYKPDPELLPVYSLGYMGTYSTDRQPTVEALLLEPARRWSEGSFVVAGPQYPAEIEWPANVERIEHLPPDRHPAFYNEQSWTLNVTRADMRKAGWSPSVRLFEAAACGTPILSDRFPGLEELLVPDSEIVLVDSAEEVLHCLQDRSEGEREAIAEAARRRILSAHTAAHRAAELEAYLK